MFYSALDCSAFPGLEAMSWLKSNTGASVCGFYLGPAPSHPAADWMPYRQSLANLGWGFLPIFVGQQIAGPGSHDISAQQGDYDGRQAGYLMKKAGFAARSTVFLDLEDGPPLAEPRTSYVKYWAGAVFGAGFMPGVYCSHAIADDVAAIFEEESVEAPRIWAFKVSTTTATPIRALPFDAPDPAGSGFANAFAWQREQNAQVATPHGQLLIDVSSCLSADPSAPGAPQT